jgi:hypothetical protein
LRLVRKADNLTAIFMPIVWRKYGILDVLQPNGPSRPLTGIALYVLFYYKKIANELNLDDFVAHLIYWYVTLIRHEIRRVIDI